MLKALLGKKKRSIAFDVTLTVHELSGVSAAANSLVWVKVKSPGCRHAESRRAQLNGQRVQWDEAFPLACKLTVDNETNVVDPFLVRLSVRAASARNTGAAFERLGVATVDLAGLVGARQTERRFLLESSAFNAILKVGVQVRQTAGDAMFRCRSQDVQQQQSASSLTNGVEIGVGGGAGVS